MDHPENPQTYTHPSGTPFKLPHNPHIPASRGIMDRNYRPDLRAQAECTVEVMQNSCASAVERHKQSGAQNSVAPSKLRGSSTIGKSVGKGIGINFVIMKVSNQHGKREKMTEHIAQYRPYHEAEPWTKIVEEIRNELDEIYMLKYQHRIYSISDFHLLYDASASRIPVKYTTGTIGALWSCSNNHPNNLHVAKKDQGTRTLKLNAIVDFPRQQTGPQGWASTGRTDIFPTQLGLKKCKSTLILSDEDDEDNITGPCLPQRVMGPGPPSNQSHRSYCFIYFSLISSCNLFPRYPTHGKSTYFSVIPTHSNAQDAHHDFHSGDQKLYHITKLSVDPEGNWTDSDSDVTVFIVVNHFASGTTKHVFKMQMGNKMYAAKRFYDIGHHSGEVNFEDNLKHLKDEAYRQHFVHETVQQFTAICAQNKVNADNLHVDLPMIVKAVDGDEKGLAWLIDLLLDSNSIRKFSGTTQAGQNTDFLGMTCDALAHFSLHVSDEEQVIVDIQGIYIKNKLTLFDSMVHTYNKAAGLGDQGAPGIKDFKKQHKCNKICRELGLKPTMICHKKRGLTDYSDSDDIEKSEEEAEVLENSGGLMTKD
ncbi:hypothetical protein D9619_012338 [Psilocybe cf. subviscida]|uniref:Alpha-type protein kinase domain-containing protein n=1 Tax=Psilocybe cf. subviscida TaxID=2480587 RepID=A0A8H5ER80_9AGAR|nr:hypothetical protein D9619_012338 [Psilocybe cf. subviscida]